MEVDQWLGWDCWMTLKIHNGKERHRDYSHQSYHRQTKSTLDHHYGYPRDWYNYSHPVAPSTDQNLKNHIQLCSNPQGISENYCCNHQHLDYYRRWRLSNHQLAMCQQCCRRHLQVELSSQQHHRNHRIQSPEHYHHQEEWNYQRHTSFPMNWCFPSNHH